MHNSNIEQKPLKVWCGSQSLGSRTWRLTTGIFGASQQPRCMNKAHDCAATNAWLCRAARLTDRCAAMLQHRATSHQHQDVTSIHLPVLYPQNHLGGRSCRNSGPPHGTHMYGKDTSQGTPGSWQASLVTEGKPRPAKNFKPEGY